MSNLNLYQIQNEFIHLADQLIELSGEITPELETSLQINQEQLEHKGRSYGYIVKQLESEVEIIDAEIKRLTAFKSSRNKTAERLKETLSNAMQLYQIEKLESPTLKISFRKSESVEVEDLSLLDKDFIVVKTTESADKTAIKKAIKEGQNVQGAVLKTNMNLQIK